MKYSVGEKVGRLTITGDSFISKERRFVPVKCECGKEWNSRLDAIVKGRTVSCGCLRNEKTIKRMTTHGQSGRKIRSGAYNSWAGMFQRCNNEKCVAYPYYGGRGIKICDRWSESFENFYEDMGDRPDGTTIDRIDNDKGYFKENCRWATHQEQMNNTRQTYTVFIEGKSMNALDAAKILGIKPHCIYKRVSKYGETPQQAVDYHYNKTPRGDVVWVVLRGEKISCREAEKRMGVYFTAIGNRVFRYKETHQQACDYFNRKTLLRDFRENIQQAAA